MGYCSSKQRVFNIEDYQSYDSYITDNIFDKEKDIDIESKERDLISAYKTEDTIYSNYDSCPSCKSFTENTVVAMNLDTIDNYDSTNGSSYERMMELTIETIKRLGTR